MGSSGYGFDLSPLEGRERASREKLHGAVRKLVLAQWKTAIPAKYRKLTGEWLTDDPGESLITLGDEDDDQEEPAEELLFNFYELAGHWLHLALKNGRPELETLLAKHGYSMGKEEVPTFGSTEYRFFEDEGRLGHFYEGEVYWQLPEVESEELESVSDAVRAKVTALQSPEAKCECPYCKPAKAAAPKKKAR